MGKRTPLYDLHVEASAKIVDFAGWDMPIHYGSQLDEHHVVRRDAGMFDVSHMRAVDARGCDAQAWLRRLIANDVAKLTTPGKALYSCLLKEDGGVIDDLIVYFFDPTHYRIVVNAGTADKDIAWMRSQTAGFNVDLTPRPDLAMIAVQGPNARAKFWAAFPDARAASEGLIVFQAAEWNGWLIARTGYTGEDGFEITLPVESGLAWTVDLKDAARDFIGRSALAARPIQKDFVGLVLLDRGVLRSHQKVVTALGAGETTSGSFSPSMNQSIALARVPRGVAPGDEVQVEIRDKMLRAKVVKPPFVRNGKVLIQEK